MNHNCIFFPQLALTGAPPSSEIYVFTDALAKDIALKDTIFALMRSSKSTVNTDLYRVEISVHPV